MGKGLLQARITLTPASQVHGHHRVPRYHPYCAWALRVLRRLVAEQYPLTDGQRHRVLAAASPRALLDATGRAVWADTPCRSRAVPGRVMEGTRLTLQRSRPTGVEFTIRTPGLPDRWLKMDFELESLWDRLRTLAAQPVSARVLESVVHEALSALFFFVHFAPLTRGSSSIAQALCVSILLAWRVVVRVIGALGRGKVRCGVVWHTCRITMASPHTHSRGHALPG